MTYHLLRDRLLLTLGSTMMSGMLLAAAAQASSGAQDSQVMAGSSSMATPSGVTKQHFWDFLKLENRDAWSELRNQFAWHEDAISADAQQRVDEWIEFYQSSPENIVAIGRRATSWLAWISQQVAERGLPGEIALIPFIESSFDPQAKSHRGAAGLWQFMPGTGDALGLVRSAHYDGRLDVIASTEAALDYIEMQADQWYDGDLIRSLAAYNAGAGTVNKAVRNAQAQGKPGDYWDLQLPSETMNYVPKLLAITKIIADPTAYNVNLPEIDAAPAFAMVDLDQDLSLKELAMRAGVDADTLSELNPGLLNGSLNPRYTRTLLMPGDSSQQMLAELGAPLNSHNEHDSTLASTSTPQTHTVVQGDSLSTIAQRYNVSLRDIMRWNAIDRPEALQPGQLLTLSSS